MLFEEKREQLRSEIWRNLSTLIKGKVALFGIPNHGNIGDSYIVLGELALLKDLGVDIIYKKILIDSSPLPDLPEDCVVLLQGGGDFGDVWRGIQEWRLSVIDRYRNHKIIIFPQTVGYFDEAVMLKDSLFLSPVKDLTICVRDNHSYELLKENFENKIILVPDMAFYIKSDFLLRYMKKKPIIDSLYLKRGDKEYISNNMSEESFSEKRDWPTVNNDCASIRMNMMLVGYTDAFTIRHMYVFSRIMRKITLIHWEYVVLPNLIKVGVEFLSKYKYITVTRMHAAILAVLLGKEFTLLNNSYNKNKNLFYTWLYDLESAKFVE